MKSAAASNSFHHPSSAHAKASFIPPAAPNSMGWPSIANPSHVMNRITNEYGIYPRGDIRTVHTDLNARKKSSGSSTAVSSSTKAKPVSKNGKIQIVLLQPVPSLGQTGDVVFVSSAIFQNTLKRNGKARLISEEEVAKLEEERMAAEEEFMEAALDMKRSIEESCDANDAALTIARKAGPEGNLFARVNPKIIMEALKESFSESKSGWDWDGKQVKLTKVADFQGNEVKKMDVKTIGEYTVDLSLGKGVDVTFQMSIVAE